jgi:hypothetical protein
MDALLRHLADVRRLFIAVAQTGFALIALIVLLYLLLGADAGPWVGSVIANLSILVDAIGQQALIAIAIIFAAALIWKGRG